MIVICEELLQWHGQENNSKRIQNRTMNRFMMWTWRYDDIAYWYPTNLNADLGTKIDDEGDFKLFED